MVVSAATELPLARQPGRDPRSVLRAAGPAAACPSVVPRGQERDEVRHRGSLTLGEAIEAALARTGDSEMRKFAREPRAVDPP